MIFMNHFDSKLFNLSLKDNLIAIKAEFEAEGTTINELAILSQFCRSHNMPLTLKIGGPLAKRDIYEAFQLGAENILAPMVESSFALGYFIIFYKTVLQTFTRLKHNPSMLINIESYLAYKNLDEILEFIKESDHKVKGLVIGRTDLSESLNEKDVNSKKIYDISLSILQKAKKENLNVTVGGKITNDSFEFLESLSKYGLKAFETRKCTFMINESFSKEKFERLVKFGLEFELEWLEHKKNVYSERSIIDDSRINSIVSRFQN